MTSLPSMMMSSTITLKLLLLLPLCPFECIDASMESEEGREGGKVSEKEREGERERCEEALGDLLFFLFCRGVAT